MPAVLVEVAFISQPRRGEAAGLGRVPGQGGGRARAGHRALPERAAARAPALAQPGLAAAGRDAAPGGRPDPRRARRPVAHGRPHGAALVARCCAPRRSREADEAAPRGGASASEPAQAAAAEPARRISVRLYFEATDRDGLLPEDRERRVLDRPRAARSARWSRSWPRGSRAASSRRCPPGTRVLEVFVPAHGVAYVDLSREVATGLPGGLAAPSC